jgi:hypothetical protein
MPFTAYKLGRVLCLKPPLNASLRLLYQITILSKG